MGFGLLGLLVGWAYVLSALYQERKDRSILFWLSLPLSNTETVLAKWLYGWIVLPMTYFLIGWVAGGIIVLISSIGAAAMVSDTALIGEAMAIHGVGMASHAGTMMVQVAWIAPFFAWSLLVSQWALRTPLLWVLGVPLVATLVENLLFDVAWLTDWFWSRANISAEMMSSESVQSLQLGLGLIVAALMIGCTIWSRRHCFDRLP
jgi:ABC-2 type transport system permease protein